MSSKYLGNDQLHSVAEVEVIICVAIIFTLPEACSSDMEGCWEEGDSEPHAETEINNPPLNEETFNTSIKPVEEPLLGSIGTVMEDVASDE